MYANVSASGNVKNEWKKNVWKRKRKKIGAQRRTKRSGKNKHKHISEVLK